jgi:hypothetical protein
VPKIHDVLTPRAVASERDEKVESLSDESQQIIAALDELLFPPTGRNA